VVLILVVAVVGYFSYRALRKPMVTGDPKEMPPLVEQVTLTLNKVTSKIIHPKGGSTAASGPTAEQKAAPVDGNVPPLHQPAPAEPTRSEPKP
jgi:hypothetical protein